MEKLEELLPLKKKFEDAEAQTGDLQQKMAHLMDVVENEKMAICLSSDSNDSEQELARR